MKHRTATLDIGAKLWSLCHLLRDDGVTYHQYLGELTYLIFLKMMQETGQESHLNIWKSKAANETTKRKLPGIRWSDLTSAATMEQLPLYRQLLIDYGTYGRGAIREIYAGASTCITKPSTISKLITEIDGLDWYNVNRDDLGDLYEDLLERNAGEKKSGAGQYFTPRALIDSIISVVKPRIGDTIQDPAAGTGGFLIAACNYLKKEAGTDLKDKDSFSKFSRNTFFGMELVQDTHRLAQMNMLLHGIDGGITYGDTLSEDHKKLPQATLILSNPPFGTKKGAGHSSRSDLKYGTSNKQLAFLQHIYGSLRPGGRAAVVLPDNVLFENNIGTDVRRELMEKCNLHTILRLPTGIFYAQGVKTNVLFFTRGQSDTGNTKETWVYDMRTNMPAFGKRTQFNRDLFRTSPSSPNQLPRDKFEDVFGDDPNGGEAALAARQDSGPNGRWRRFTRMQLEARGDNLDVSWLSEDRRDSMEAANDRPEEIIAMALDELGSATTTLRSLLEELREGQDSFASESETP